MSAIGTRHFTFRARFRARRWRVCVLNTHFSIENDARAIRQANLELAAA
jgi:hypothetical protein